MIRKTISIRKAFYFGLNFIKNNIKTSIIITVILNLFYLLPLIKDYSLVCYNIVGIIGIIVLYLYAVELVQIAHCWYNHHCLTIKDLKLSPLVILRHFAGFLIFLFLFSLTTLLLIIPGIYYFITYYFFQYFIIDQNYSIRKAFKESNKITKGVKWKLLGFHLLVYTPSILRFLFIRFFDHRYLIDILFILGPIWSILAGLATFHIYRQLLEFS